MTGQVSQMDREPVLIDLALQGGGSHGAFTWGVLDRFLEEPWFQIEAISGTSAGAMNAAVLADGWVQGQAEGATRTPSSSGLICCAPSKARNLADALHGVAGWMNELRRRGLELANLLS